MAESIWNDPRITAYVLDELSGDEQSQFESELQENPQLAAAVEEARGLTDQLAAFYAAEPTPRLEEHRRASILGGEPAKASPAADDRRGWLRRHWVACAVAASLLVVVAGLSVPALQMASQQTALDRGEEKDADAARTQQLAKSIRQSEPPPERALAEETPGLSEQPMAADSPADEAMAADSQKSPAAAGPDGDSPVASEQLQRFNRQRSEPEADFAFEDPRAPAQKLSEEAALESHVEAAPEPVDAEELSLEWAAPGMAPGERVEQQSRSLGRRGGAAAAGEEMMEMGMGMGMDGGMGGGVPLRFEAEAGRRTTELFTVPAGPDYGLPIDEGRGPGIAGDRFEPITDNPFRRVSEHEMSTLSVDVDTASYSKVRDFLMRANQLPRPDAVRIEELVNYFDYDYPAPPPDAEHPFSSHVEITSCPWNDQHRLARIALKGKELSREDRPRCNLVFLLDTSGSMNAPNKLPLVQKGMKMLLEQLNSDDRVAITVYAGSAGLVLDSTPAGNKGKIRRALTRLSSGGSTNGGAGIALAYRTARDHFIEDGVNRVILCTDGDFNVGTTGTDELVRMVEREAKGGVFLSVLGFGMGNHNDAMLEKISGRGNGNYAFIDHENEAYKVLVEQTAGTLVTIAKDVKLQVVFNSTHVSSYRLIGYENRLLAKEDFNDDTKDAGEIGAGHSVTALYELVPTGTEPDAARPPVTPSKYQAEPELTAAADSDEVLELRLRYKQPDGDTSERITFPVTDSGGSFEQADVDVRFAAAVAGFGMQLRRSEYAGDWTLADVQRVAVSALGEDRFGLRAEFVELVKRARQLTTGE